jgi:hypothetical protein
MSVSVACEIGRSARTDSCHRGRLLGHPSYLSRPSFSRRHGSDAILSEFDDAPVRSFVLTIAERQIRDCLREDLCAALAQGGRLSRRGKRARFVIKSRLRRCP